MGRSAPRSGPFPMVRVEMTVTVPGAGTWKFTSEEMGEDFADVLLYELRQVTFKVDSARKVSKESR